MIDKLKYATVSFRGPVQKLETRTGWIFKKTEQISIPSLVDIVEYGQLLENAYNELDHAGYDVINVVPVLGGNTEELLNKSGSLLAATGHSITRGAVVVGKLREDDNGQKE